MELILRIEQGPGEGKEFRTAAAGRRIVVGREDPTSQAEWRLAREDLYASRRHFELEVSPQGCLIRDLGSTSGTWHRPAGSAEWRRVSEARLEDGDRIRAGRCVLAVTIRGLEPSTVVAVPAGEGEEPERYCVRCGGPLAHTPALTGVGLRDLDFMCDGCRIQVAAVRGERSAAHAGEPVRCQGEGCGADLTSLADRDGRAAELADCAFYLCQRCAWLTRKLYREIGDWVLLNDLGRGAMGVVYKAWHATTGRVAALKLLQPVPELALAMGDKLRLRFLRECSIMQDLVHPHLVRLFEVGQDGDQPYFVSEFVTGGDLGRFLSPEGAPLLPPQRAVDLVADALLGLEFFHGHGYVHRDIKPENILLAGEGEQSVPKLADFGLARSFAKHGDTITTSEVGGTKVYMPPEQLVDFKRCRPTVDVYAMGVTLYYLLSGRFPLDFPTYRRKQQGPASEKSPLRMIQEDPPLPLEKAGVPLPAGVCRAVDGALHKDPRRRYQMAGEFRGALLGALGS